MKKSAFTIVELVVIIAILVILASTSLVSYNKYLSGVRDATRISEIASLGSALESYRARKFLPKPDERIDVIASGSHIAWQ